MIGLDFSNLIDDGELVSFNVEFKGEAPLTDDLSLDLRFWMWII